MTECVEQTGQAEEKPLQALVAERTGEFEVSFNQHIQATNIHSYDQESMTALGLIQKDLEAHKLTGVFSDFFELVRIYYEGVDNLNDVAINKVTTTGGNIMLYLNHSGTFLPGDAQVEEGAQKALMASLTFTEVNRRSGDVEFVIQPEEEEDTTRLCPVHEQKTFLETMEGNVINFNTHYKGNHGLLMYQIFIDFFKSLQERQTLVECRSLIQQVDRAPETGYVTYTVVYRKYCALQQRTVHTKAVLFLRSFSFIRKAQSH